MGFWVRFPFVSLCVVAANNPAGVLYPIVQRPTNDRIWGSDSRSFLYALWPLIILQASYIRSFNVRQMTGFGGQRPTNVRIWGSDSRSSLYALWPLIILQAFYIQSFNVRQMTGESVACGTNRDVHPIRKVGEERVFERVFDPLEAVT